MTRAEDVADTLRQVATAVLTKVAWNDSTVVAEQRAGRYTHALREKGEHEAALLHMCSVQTHVFLKPFYESGEWPTLFYRHLDVLGVYVVLHLKVLQIKDETVLRELYAALPEAKKLKSALVRFFELLHAHATISNERRPELRAIGRTLERIHTALVKIKEKETR